MDFNVSDRTIYLVRHGSHAYGTSTPTSDEDFKGICVPPRDYYLGFMKSFEQAEKYASKGHDRDEVVYSVEKFFKLAADCNPNIIEVLCVDDSDVVKIDEFGELLRAHRNAFLSTKARHTFSGYAHAQLRRIETHRRWLFESSRYERPRPTREEHGLKPQKDGYKAQIEMALAQVEKKLDEWNIDMMGMEESEKINLKNRLSEHFGALEYTRNGLWLSAAVASFENTNLIYELQQERAYANVVSDWEKYHDWKKNRNPARAELEAKFGYDTKHAGHFIRLMRMCREILEGKGVIVRRPDAEEILDIRRGRRDYDSIIEEARRIDAECNELYKTSKLPRIPDRAMLDGLCVKIVEEFHRKKG